MGRWHHVVSRRSTVWQTHFVVITPDGAEERIDAARESSAERIKLGLINNSHCVSINNASSPRNRRYKPPPLVASEPNR
jgi:hypothetical protein